MSEEQIKKEEIVKATAEESADKKKEESLKTPAVDVSKVEDDKVVLNDAEAKQVNADAEKALEELDRKRTEELQKELASIKDALSKEFDSKLAAIKESYDKELNDIKSQRKGLVTTTGNPFSTSETKVEEPRPPTLEEFKNYIGRR